MSEQTCSTMPVYLDNASIEIGGRKIPVTIEGEVNFTYTYYPAQNMSGRMEDAIPSDSEVTLDEVDLNVTLHGVRDTDAPTASEGQIQFTTNSIEFYDEHFGELDCTDVAGYT